MKQPEFVNNEIYHIYNRGVEKRKIFLDEKDYFRFIHNLFEFNDVVPASNRRSSRQKQLVEVGLPPVRKPRVKPMEVRLPRAEVRKPRELLVNILAFCLMPNHFHLILIQKEDKGITRFMRKMGTGYTNYFNTKYDRVGPLFQGKFKAKIVRKDEYLLHLVDYIHLNPAEIIRPKWKDGETGNLGEIKNFLQNYRWSSFLDYIGKKNFPSITQRNFLLNFFSDIQDYEKEFFSQFQKIDLEKIKELIIE